MASSKRDFKDFKSFPGSFKTVNKNVIYSFPKITYTDILERERVWTIYIRLVTDDMINNATKINWVLHENSSIDINNKHYSEVDDGIISQIWTEQGINSSNYKITRSVPTYIKKGKNKGKVNETNVFTQALINARSKYLKQLDKHITTVINHGVINNETVNNNVTLLSHRRVYPVAVHKYEYKPRDSKKHITYPCIVQRKLDGGRAVAYYDKKVSLYTRRLKCLEGNKHLVDELECLYKTINEKFPGAYLDGEIYKHGMSLQQISGIMRREKSSKRRVDEDPVLEYHIFDVFFPFIKDEIIVEKISISNEMPLNDRLKVLNTIFKNARVSKFIKQVKSIKADSIEKENELYNQFIDEKYEGSIVKNLNAPYEYGLKKEIRSYQMRKRKPRYSAEYEIVGFTQGEQGKDKGAIIFVMKTKDTKTKQSVEFNASPVGIDYKERYKMFNQMTKKKFKDIYLGKMMTVEYDDISDAGVPLRAKAKVVRIDDF